MLPLCLNLAAKSTKLMKKKAISDFNFMTAVEKNCNIILAEKTFNRFVLDLLCTVFPPKSDSEKDPIWEMGCKLYIQMNKICFNTDNNAFQHIHYLIAWPINRIIEVRNRRDLYRNEVIKKERMVRTILCGFFETLASDKERDKHHPTIVGENHHATWWRNFISCVFAIEELVFSFGSSYKADNKGETPRHGGGDNTFLLEYTNSLLEPSDNNGQLYGEVAEGLFYSTKKTWHDARLLDFIFELLETIWFMKSRRRSSKPKKGGVVPKDSYKMLEDNVLDCIEDLTSNEANDKIMILLFRKS